MDMLMTYYFIVTKNRYNNHCIFNEIHTYYIKKTLILFIRFIFYEN